MSGLFDDEELLRLENGNLFSDKPVTVLGKTFSNDEERREYFREELRKKLPELKKLEGYPIGEDEDIINLSDPPYYTACPNPWLNDFVAEWEKEKESPELKKLRKDDFEVKEPYASDVSEGKNNPIYNAHSYHTKVPHPAIMRYILHYTQPGDIVLDGFAGTGMTGVAAQMCGNPDIDLKTKIEAEYASLGYKKPVWGTRHAVLGDLSPVASFIAYNYNTPVDSKAFALEAKKILAEVEKECGWMYETKHTDGSIGKINYVVWSDVFICPDCGGEIVFYDVAVDKEKGEVKEEFACSNCGAKHSKKQVSKAMQTVFDKTMSKTIQQSKTVPVLIQYVDEKGKRHEKKPDDFDFELIKKIENTEIPYWFPTDELPKGEKTQDPINHHYTNIHYFFTNRNLFILAKLRDEIQKRTLPLIVLNSIVTSLVSILVRFNLGKRGNGIFPGAIFVPSLIAEANIFRVFLGKAKDFEKAFFLLKNPKNSLTLSSASNIKLYDNSVDYIFTDPPFGANIMYSELNFIQESWLKVKTNNKEEAIENRTQQKGLLDYQNIMQKCFVEYYRVLKPGKWITIEFSNTSASVWNGIQLSLNRSGFVIANISSIDKQQGSFNAVTSPTAVKQDLVISCYKPSETFTKNFQIQDGHTNTWSFIQEHLEHLPIPFVKDEKTTSVIERSPKILYDRLITYFFMRGLPVPMDAADFQEGLRNRYVQEDGMFFTSQQLNKYLELKKKYNLTGQLDLFVTLIETESDAVQWVKEKLEENPLKYQDLQPDYRKAYATNRKGEIQIELRDVLEENFIQQDDGAWRIPNFNEQKDREILRTKALLKIWEDYCTQVESGKVKKLKDVRLEAVKAGFKDCYQKKDFKRIVTIGDKIPENLLTEDETLLNYYDIACSKV
ncbi:MAG: DNA methylase [Bacilli bacterium]|nr:DNA methylase [Bacilli bacterium]